MSALVVLLLIIALRLYFAIRSLPRNFYGLCSGAGPELAPGRPPLTNWLYCFFNELAGMPLDRPLTFGDLWHAGKTEAEAQRTNELARGDREARSINLEVMTTCVSHGRPYVFPLLPSGSRPRSDGRSIFYFAPDEFRRLFPKPVVDWMIEKAPAADADEPHTTADGRALHPLPAMENLPIIAAVRMSLSFPVLLSAVPLYAIDYTHRKTGEVLAAEHCWFSDGGICSNFPIHFFDGPLPRRSTFGVSLRSFPRTETPPMVASGTVDAENEARSVFLPATNLEGTNENWTRFPEKGSDALPGFLGAILATMQSWSDNLLCHAPGYRDRIAWVSHTDEEGGLNLDMKSEVIASLARRGQYAGRGLMEAFTQVNPKLGWTGWENQLWVRYRSLLSVLQTFMRSFVRAYETPEIGSKLEAWTAGPVDATKSYRLPGPLQQQQARAVTEELLKLGGMLGADRHDLAASGPHPEPELRFKPRA